MGVHHFTEFICSTCHQYCSDCGFCKNVACGRRLCGSCGFEVSVTKLDHDSLDELYDTELTADVVQVCGVCIDELTHPNNPCNVSD